MVKLAPSKNPEKESKLFSILALASGILSLIIWPLGIAGLAFGVRGVILSQRVKNKKYLTFSIIGILLGGVSIVYLYTA